jgi:hypothetical protein
MTLPQDAGSSAPSGADDLPLLDAAALRALAAARQARSGCACRRWVCPGWESTGELPRPPQWQRVGTLRAAGDAEPTLQEWHPAGTHYWDPRAPISVAHHPANRAEVWRCSGCGRVLLAYVEAGGYYSDPRVREVAPALVC